MDAEGSLSRAIQTALKAQAQKLTQRSPGVGFTAAEMLQGSRFALCGFANSDASMYVGMLLNAPGVADFRALIKHQARLGAPKGSSGQLASTPEVCRVSFESANTALKSTPGEDEPQAQSLRAFLTAIIQVFMSKAAQPAQLETPDATPDAGADKEDAAFTSTDAAGMHRNAVPVSQIGAKWHARHSSAVTAPAKPPYSHSSARTEAGSNAQQAFRKRKEQAQQSSALNSRSVATAGEPNPDWVDSKRKLLDSDLKAVQRKRAEDFKKRQAEEAQRAVDEDVEAATRRAIAASLQEAHGGATRVAPRPKRGAAQAASASLDALRISEGLDSPPRRSRRRAAKRRRAPLEQLFAFPAPYSATVAHMRAHGFLASEAGSADKPASQATDGNETEDTVLADGAPAVDKDAGASSGGDSSDATPPKRSSSSSKTAAPDAIDLVSDSSGESDDSVVLQDSSSGEQKSVPIVKGNGTHPLPPKLGSVPVSNRDAECLEPGEYLNDTIIDWALKFRLLRGVDGSVRKRVHIMSSLFFKELRSYLDEDLSGLPPVQRYANGYRQVAKWTRKVNIFEKDFIIIPVNDR